MKTSSNDLLIKISELLFPPSKECEYHNLHPRLRKMLDRRINRNEKIEFCATTAIYNRKLAFLISENRAFCSYFDGFTVLVVYISGEEVCEVVEFKDISIIHETKSSDIYHIELRSNNGGNKPLISFDFPQKGKLYIKLLMLLQQKIETAKVKEKFNNMTHQERVKILKSMLDAHLISQEIYEARVSEIIQEI